mmetsp:Transcript_91200/g.273880  ORF Transcript_91200/g.273880 Transcript_91200/m.273880 type:complete len:324 (-) Transcript_91200:27-998(-)
MGASSRRMANATLRSAWLTRGAEHSRSRLCAPSAAVVAPGSSGGGGSSATISPCRTRLYTARSAHARALAASMRGCVSARAAAAVSAPSGTTQLPFASARASISRTAARPRSWLVGSTSSREMASASTARKSRPGTAPQSTYGLARTCASASCGSAFTSADACRSERPSARANVSVPALDCHSATDAWMTASFFGPTPGTVSSSSGSTRAPSTFPCSTSSVCSPKRSTSVAASFGPTPLIRPLCSTMSAVVAGAAPIEPSSTCAHDAWSCRPNLDCTISPRTRSCCPLNAFSSPVLAVTTTSPDDGDASASDGGVSSLRRTTV